MRDPFLRVCYTHLTALLTGMIIFTSVSAQTTMHEVIFTEKAPAPIGPYSQAIRAGNMIFISGQIAIDPATGEFIPGQTAAQEASRVMENIRAIVEAAGCQMNQIVKCTIFLDDMQKFAEVNAVYAAYFPQQAPARETVAVAALPKAAQVEISAIVVL
jgi:2-iminobutanoate/2-iminopropanoate deaminase